MVPIAFKKKKKSVNNDLNQSVHHTKLSFGFKRVGREQLRS